MSSLFALASAVSFGFSDFFGGYAAKQLSASRVALRASFASLALATSAWFVAGGDVTVRDTALGAGAGLAGMLGIVFLFRALAVGPMAAVSPITAFVGALVPFTIGLLAGERPGVAALTGAILGLLAVPLVSGIDQPTDHRPARSTVVMAVVAGFGFGAFFAFIAQVSVTSGLWPLVPAKLAAIVVLIVVVRSSQQSSARVPRSVTGWALASGFIDMSANIFFLLATRTGLLSIVGVISSLYPAVTVALGRIVLKEPLSVLQMMGVGMIVVALGLIGF